MNESDAPEENKLQILSVICVLAVCSTFGLIIYNPATIRSSMIIFFCAILTFIISGGLSDYSILLPATSIIITLIYVGSVVYRNREKINSKNVTFRYKPFIIIAFCVISIQCFSLMAFSYASKIYKFNNQKLIAIYSFFILLFEIVIFITYLNNLYLKNYSADG